MRRKGSELWAITPIIIDMKQLVLLFIAAAHFSVFAAEPEVPTGWVKTKPFQPVIYSASAVSNDEDLKINSHLSIQVHRLDGKVAKLQERLKEPNSEIGMKISERCYRLKDISIGGRQTWCFGYKKASVLVEAGPTFPSEEFSKQLLNYTEEQAL